MRRCFGAVESTLDREIVADASAARDRVERQIIIDVGLLFAIVLIAMLIAWLVARSMNRALRELKHGALTVARQGLPQAVARLRDPTLATQLSPQQIALQIAEPLPVRSRDEFGEVTEAFNAVHIEAVRTAAEQAVLRSSVATMFVNLARRSQILVDRLIGHLDRLERGEEDPDRLAELFQLDHLATRMRRNDENLLVLAGADSTRVQREPAPLVDVLRAAQSEVEHYTRIEFGSIDRDLEIASHAVNDLVHLVAELLDNATAFSPPDSPVLVEARRFGDRAVLYVEDRGIGISADQLADLNDRLAKPPLVDVAVSRMMGLVVVARLAARHGVEVKLRPAADRGTVADVLAAAVRPDQHEHGVPGRAAGRRGRARGTESERATTARGSVAVRGTVGAGEWTVGDRADAGRCGHVERLRRQLGERIQRIGRVRRLRRGGRALRHEPADAPRSGRLEPGAAQLVGSDRSGRCRCWSGRQWWLQRRPEPHRRSWLRWPQRSEWQQRALGLVRSPGHADLAAAPAGVASG